MKLALCMICKGSDAEAEVLKRCLAYTAPYVDDIFVTVTQPNKRVGEVGALFKAHMSYYEWTNDFAAARNYSFQQVPKDYTHIVWLDADDVPRGWERLKKIIKENPDVDTLAMNYLYAFDEYKNPIVVHIKTRVVKNDGCVEWAGKLHEDFKRNRDVTTKFIDGIEVLHLSNDERFESAKERNLEVAQAQIAAEPDDPRSYWNLGNSLKACGRDLEALQAFDEFLTRSQSDDEKYLVRLRRAEIFLGLAHYNEAIDEARLGIGTKPEYPDAYHLLGTIYFNMRQWQKAEEMYLLGISHKPPVHSIIVYNPRDYDYVPLINLAKVYFQMDLPTMALPCLEACLKIYPQNEDLQTRVKLMKKEVEKWEKVMKYVVKLKTIYDKEKLRKALDKVPEEYQSEPSICNLRNINFVKEESSGRDLVIYCGYTSEEWTPETAKEKGIGGSEEAVIWLSKLLAEKGWNVTVYNNCGHKALTFDKVTYKPFWSFNYRDKQDVVILWRSPKALDWAINAPKIYLDLHDVIPAGELTEARVARLTKIMVKSEFHRSLFPNVPNEKFLIIPNGIDAKLFEAKLPRDEKLVINTSSPDRSLSALLECFKEVKKQVPDAKLKWAYGWGVFDASHSDDMKMMAWKDELMKKAESIDGVEVLGRLNHEDVAKLYMQANVFGYPTEFAEIHCLSAVKAQAGGAIPITTDFAALDETVSYGTKIHSKKTKDDWCKPYQFDFALEDPYLRRAWIRKVVHLLQNPPTEREREQMRAWARDTYSWDVITNRWDEELSS